jgi:3-oxoadipate CoA-transferase alpha subunit
MPAFAFAGKTICGTEGNMPKSKTYTSFAAAVADIPDGVTIGFGGFAVVGMPINLYQALAEQGAKNLTCVSNGTRGGSTMPSDAPTMEWLISNDQVSKVVCSFTAPTRASQKLVFSEYYEKGLIEAELVPQGTLAERLRAAGAGIPAFYTPAAVGTELAEGRETRVFDGREYLLEEALPLDYAFIRAWQADAFGNLRFRRS